MGDATLIVDTSGSICAGQVLGSDNECDNFNLMEDFVADMTGASTIADMTAAMILFSDNAEIKLNHGDLVGGETISNEVEARLEFLGGQTNIGKALKLYIDSVDPEISQPHNIYILTDGKPTDEPCLYADAFNHATERDNVYLLVVGLTSLHELSCINAQVIILNDFNSLDCPHCEDTRASCSTYTCPHGYSSKPGDHSCEGSECSDIDRDVCCDITCDGLSVMLKECTPFDATFIVDTSGSICYGQDLDDNGECLYFNGIESFIERTALASTKSDMSAAMIQFSTDAVMVMNHGDYINQAKLLMLQKPS